MSTEEFIKKCKEEVKRYTLDNLNKNGILYEFDIYMVWYSKTLQNHKALLSTSLMNGMYFELTFNGDKQELYFDAYKKTENKCIKC